MRLVNIFLNGLKMLIPEKSSVKDILERFFNPHCEFLVCANSKALPNKNFSKFFIKENDCFQIITYSKQAHNLYQSYISKTDNEW